MEYIQSLLLSIIQGITEFLPISSSAHLILLPTILNTKDQGLVIDLAAHLGSLLAVVLFFKDDSRKLTRGIVDFLLYKETKASRFFLLILIATLPIVVVGLIFHEFIGEALRSPLIIAFTTIGWGLFLGGVDHLCSKDKDYSTLGIKDALIIGIFQVLSLIPGTSRSGITMSAGRLMGLKREDTAHFSLVLSIPTTLAAIVLVFWKAFTNQSITPNGVLIFLVVISTSFFASYLTLKFLMRWLKFRSFFPFVFYRLILGALILIYY